MITELKLDKQMETLAKLDAFLMLTDHTNRFMNNLSWRLINPEKSETGRVSQAVLDEIVHLCSCYDVHLGGFPTIRHNEARYLLLFPDRSVQESCSGANIMS